MSGIDPCDLAKWQSAIGRSEVRHEGVEAESLRRYALAIGADPAVEDVLPPLAHWALFLPQPADGDLGVDGHPKRGGFLPDITLPRRMFAASDMIFDAPLLIGVAATQESCITHVQHKSGKSGDLIFVEVERRLRQRGQLCVQERQSYVYRAFGPAVPLPTPAPAPVPVQPPTDAQTPTDGEIWQPTAAHLFRFSAATFNSHRIHYDLPYARGVEGYPALVVHGPLTAAKLAGLAGRRGALAQFAFRAEAPLFLGQEILLHASDDGLCAIRCDGVTAMRATRRYQ